MTGHSVTWLQLPNSTHCGFISHLTADGKVERESERVRNREWSEKEAERRCDRTVRWKDREG